MTDRLGILAPTDPFPVVIELRVFAEMVGIRGVAVVADHVDERCLSEIRELVAGGDAVAVIVFTVTPILFRKPRPWRLALTPASQ